MKKSLIIFCLLITSGMLNAQYQVTQEQAVTAAINTILLCTVTVNNRNVRQRIAQGVAFFFILLNELDASARVGEELCEVITDSSAADNHNVIDLVLINSALSHK